MSPSYNDSVFINCPFDADYREHLEAIVFAIYRCGFYPVNALAEDNALHNRLDKIQSQIENCRYAIHDISRVQLNASGFPRFNMPFELGLFFGAKRFGNKTQKTKNALVFEGTRFSYQNYLSDLSGVDVKAHNNNAASILRNIRNWLSTSSRRKTIPGYNTIIKDFESFQTQLPAILTRLSLERDDLPFNDLCVIIEEYLKSLLDKDGV